jgi:hypothetical protein
VTKHTSLLIVIFPRWVESREHVEFDVKGVRDDLQHHIPLRQVAISFRFRFVRVYTSLSVFTALFLLLLIVSVRISI